MISLVREALRGKPRALKKVLKIFDEAGLLTAPPSPQTHGVLTIPKGFTLAAFAALVGKLGYPPWEAETLAAAKAEYAEESKPAGGRKPAPIKYRFLKGKSGNPRGRPRGSVTLSTAARKVALKKPSVKGETAKRQTVIEHVLDVLKREAARGIPSMMDLFEHIYRKLNPYADNRPGGFLVVPETLTQEEWMAQAEKHNATARDPSLPREPDAETEAAAAVAEMKRKLVLAEVEKARHGLSSPLGHAMLAYERKWRESYSPVR